MSSGSNNDHARLVRTRAAGLMFALLTASTGFAQGADLPHGGWLESILASLARLEAQAQDQAAEAERKIVAAELAIRQSKDALAAAETAGNPAARNTARQALDRATSALTRAERLREAARRNQNRAHTAAQAVRKLAASGGAVRGGALLAFQQGEVQVAAGMDGGWQALDPTVARPLQNGDRLRTGPGGRAEIFLADGQSRIVLDEQTTLTVHDEPDRSWIDLALGRIRLTIRKWSKEYRVRTPAAVFGVRGTDFVVHHNEARGTELIVFDGVVAMDSSAESRPVEVRSGERVLIRPDGVVEGPQRVDADSSEA